VGRGFAGAAVIGLCLAGAPAGALAAERGLALCPAAPARACAAAGPGYEADPVRRALVGRGYRALWTAPVEVPLLDLAEAVGGLAPIRVVGGGQSENLALRGADGRAYTFRPLEKDLSRLVSPTLQRAVPRLRRLVRDQGAALHPGATVLASALGRAAGLLEPELRLVALPDDARLGTFRARFAGRLGTLGEHPTPAAEGRAGTFGATEIVDTETLVARLDEGGGACVDARAYLRARLVDLVVGDADRHPGNWRWARVPGRAGWQPLPEDRDLAFARFGGALLRLVKPFAPLLVTFDEGYEIERLAHEARALDERFLAPMSAAAWDVEARALQRALAPAALDEAFARLPRAWQRADGGWLRRTLEARVAALPAAAAALRALVVAGVPAPAPRASDPTAPAARHAAHARGHGAGLRPGGR